MANILLVERDHDIRRVMALMLERMGHDVSQLGVGQLALERARQLHPDLIIVDVSPVGLDGVAIARELRADLRVGATPILAATTHAFAVSSELCEAGGFDGVLVKPFSMAQLQRAVSALLGSGAAQYG